MHTLKKAKIDRHDGIISTECKLSKINKNQQQGYINERSKLNA